jgi:hypothetical protein
MTLLQIGWNGRLWPFADEPVGGQRGGFRGRPDLTRSCGDPTRLLRPLSGVLVRV